MKRRAVLWVSQLALAAAVGWFVWWSVRRNWAAFRSLDVTMQMDVPLILAAAITVVVTYGALVEAWRRVLRGWGQHLRFGDAARVWCLSNLGRYVPGKVWSLAGLTVLAQRLGVSGWAAAGAALAMQALAVGTGACVVAVAVPGVVSPAQLGLAALVAGSVVVLLVWSPAGSAFTRMVRPSMEFHALPARTGVLAATITLASWVSYGFAFWLLVRGLLPAPTLPISTAVGIFAAGYLMGLLAVFAPGGVGVRELIFIGLLTPSVGAGGAVAVSIGSRLLLTITEVASAVGALAARRRERLAKDAFDAGRS